LVERFVGWIVPPGEHVRELTLDTSSVGAATPFDDVDQLDGSPRSRGRTAAPL
jgi:hypothetical protein